MTFLRPSCIFFNAFAQSLRYLCAKSNTTSQFGEKQCPQVKNKDCSDNKPRKCIPVFAHIDNFQIVSMTAETLPKCLELLKSNYTRFELACRAVDIASKPEGLNELEGLAKDIAKDGISLAVVDKEDNTKVLGFSFNKVVAKDNKDYFSEWSSKSKNESFKSLLNFMATVESTHDLYKQYEAILKPVFVNVVGGARQRKIGTTLFDLGADMVKKCQDRDGFRMQVSEEPLEEFRVPPEIFSCIMTNSLAQKIAKRLRFKRLATIGYDKFKIGEKTFASFLKNTKETYVTYESMTPK